MVLLTVLRSSDERRTMKGVSVFRGDLELGSKDAMELPMRISVHAYNKVKVEALPGLKKGSSLVEAEDGLGGVVKMDRTYHRWGAFILKGF